MAVTCIVPFRNEKLRIGWVIDALLKVKNISQIICVDGASDDNGFQYVQENYPQVELVRLEENVGKTGTVQEGIKRAKEEYILFFDADLSGVIPQEVDTVLSTVLADPTIDMVIFSRNTPRLITKLNRFDLIYSGERILKKSTLIEILKKGVSMFQLEIAINTFMMSHHKKIYYFSASHTNLPKSGKFGLFAGLMEDIKMFWQVCSFDPINYFMQTFFFCRNELPRKL
jgi:glycosyltransferase involved in cell wall biosynthesis